MEYSEPQNPNKRMEGFFCTIAGYGNILHKFIKVLL